MIKHAIENCKRLIKESTTNLSSMIDGFFPDENCKAFIESTEKLALCARDLAQYCPTQKECDKAENSIGRAMDIQVGQTPEGFFKVSLPMLHHRNDRNGCDFIRKPLRAALANYFENHQIHIGKGVLVCIFYYSGCGYDIDNINDNEYKAIIDDISLFVLPDDGPFVCSRFLSARRADNEHTEVYVISEKDFPKWYQEYTDFDDKIQQNNL